jgi:hypothetical protein
MSEGARQKGGEQTSSSMVLVVVLWGLYQTLTGVVAVFAG